MSAVSRHSAHADEPEVEHAPNGDPDHILAMPLPTVVPEKPPGLVSNRIYSGVPVLRAVQANLRVIEEIRSEHPWVPRTLVGLFQIAGLFLFSNSVIAQIQGHSDRPVDETAIAVAGHWPTWLIAAIVAHLLWGLTKRGKRYLRSKRKNDGGTG